MLGNVVSAEQQSVATNIARQEQARADEMAARQFESQQTQAALGAEAEAAAYEDEEARRLREERLRQEQLAFTQTGQLASMDAAEEQNLISQQMGANQQDFAVNRALGGDPTNVILGRTGGQAMAQGSGVLAAGQQQAQAGFQPLFDPNVGVNLGMQDYANQTSMANAQTAANASQSAGLLGAIGQIGAAAVPLCWVAREVYGETNPKWLQFREWMLTKAPVWFRNLYIKHGEKFAKFISNKPMLKSIIRNWMNGRIA